MRISLCVLVLASVAMRALAAPPISATPLPPRAAFENLKSNASVAWLVRMVAYDPENPVLRIDHLASLGAPNEDYTFVADYAELRGYSVQQAAHKAGGALPPGYDVSCVIFPISRHTIFPASVRGMLQVVQQIDMRRAAEPGYRTAPLDILLSDTERRNLAAVDLKSWAWDNYRSDFLAFARAFARLRSQNASAIGHIGHIGHDWCEPGCSRMLHSPSADDENLMTLELPGGGAFPIKNFGVRVFLIRNQPIKELAGRVLIDFNDPEHQHIPLDLPSSN